MWIIPVVVVVVFWMLLSYVVGVSRLFLPSPVAVGFSLWDMVRSVVFYHDVFWTLYRVFIGVGVGVIVGLPVGFAMGLHDGVYRSMEFFTDFLRSIPGTALFPLFVLMFGIGNVSKVVIIFWTVSLVMLVNAMYGVYHASALRRKTMRLLGFGWWDYVWKVLVYEALPSIFNGLRVSVSLGLVIGVVVEMFVGTKYGLGHRILEASLVYNTAVVYSSLIMLGLVGYLLNKAIVVLQKRIVYWGE